MNRLKILFKLLVLLTCISLGTNCRKTGFPPVEVTKPIAPPTILPGPPKSLLLSSFYKKYLDADSIPIVSSEYTDDEALFNAKKTILIMLGSLDESVKKQMRSNKIRIAIISQYELTNSLPENVGYPDSFNIRARGFAAAPWSPMMCTAEENLVCGHNMLIRDRWYGQDVTTHEFAHTIHLTGLLHSPFDSILNKTYNNAMSKKLWDSTYSATSYLEYWADGVQLWFNCTAMYVPLNNTKIIVSTRGDLNKYDPDLYDLISKYFTNETIKTGCY